MSKGETVLVGLSGGADSVALLHVLLALKPLLDIKLLAAHLHHGLRGQAADDDLAFVQALCEKENVPLFTKKIDIAYIAKEMQLSIETAGRKERYAFFEAVKAQAGATKIAVAHHLNDQAETMLMHLIRGAGMNGLSGMVAKRADGIVRPLLEVTKQEILNYCTGHQLSYQTDLTNNENQYNRNHIRNQLVPYIEKHFNPNLIHTLSHTSQLLTDDEQYLEQTASTWRQTHQVGNAMPIDALKKLPMPIMRRALRQMYFATAEYASDLGFVHLQAIIALIENNKTGTQIHLPQNVIAKCSYDRFYFEQQKDTEQYKGGLILPNAGVYHSEYFNCTLTLEIISQGEFEKFKPSKTAQAFDANILQDGLIVRKRKTGDKMALKNMHKKLQDIFTDEKVPKEKRDLYPVLATNDAVIWAVGLRRAHAYFVTKQTKEILRIEITGGKDND
ncbi:MAG: tRNA lysidine(34) synthetase TilS [Hyphomonadaceae bacterium]|nr:tRNA lysidine(34) synthetase TilS [Clostridia bacterium]